MLRAALAVVLALSMSAWPICPAFAEPSADGMGGAGNEEETPLFVEGAPEFLAPDEGALPAATAGKPYWDTKARKPLVAFEASGDPAPVFALKDLPDEDEGEGEGENEGEGEGEGEGERKPDLPLTVDPETAVDGDASGEVSGKDGKGGEGGEGEGGEGEGDHEKDDPRKPMRTSTGPARACPRAWRSTRRRGGSKARPRKGCKTATGWCTNSP